MTSDSTTAPRNAAGVFEGSVASDAAASVTVVAFNVALYTAVRYAPEYLRLLGNGPVVIGLFGSIATLLAVAVPRLGFVADRLRSSAAPVVGALASLGMVCWLAAPQLGPTDGVRTVALVFVGLALIESWQAVGPETAAAIGVVPQRIRDRVPQVIRHARTPRYVALLAGLPVVVGLLTLISPAITALQVVLGLAAAIGVTTTVLLAVLDEDEIPAASADLVTGSARSNDATDDETAADGWITTPDEPIRSTLDSLRSLPRSVRQPLFGDALVEFAVGMVSVFLVITVTSVLRIDVTLLGQRLRPDAFFGVCLVAEMGVALIATEPLTRLANRIGRERVVAGTLLVAALFPITLVSAPANAAIVAGLFAAFGLYRAGLPTRHAFVDGIMTGDDTTTETDDANDISDDRRGYRTARAALRVPSALVGGVLYAVSPTLAFGLAAVVGAVGVREFLVGTTRLGGDPLDAG
ncbi:hypothetical protein [Halococcus saccharolyticus]|uniref:Transporter possibly hexose n=1 Tax=Halococcus saccharolyticus DSM 5350 TaxID=1227455 RepID=M0MSY5_9EURY|nr:hypothetical protein [Halococcus saccharolyticus]EMA47859.1 transporter possibly hexose [Halococcus saccharolyticus DSM 5350]